MQSLNLPPFDHKTKLTDGKPYIYDQLRRKYVALTPEEWVRQHFVQLLLVHYGYTRALLRIEGTHRAQQRQRRCDVLAYDRAGQPFLLVECKAPDVPLDEAVFAQAARYNAVHGAPYLVLTNGLRHLCCRVANGQYAICDHIPHFPESLERYATKTSPQA